MPEVLFRVRWPDDTTSECYSPSRAITHFLDAGTVYALDDFLVRSRAGLMAASERVRARYGHRCTRAEAQLLALEAEAARHDTAAPVVVEAIRAVGSSAR